MIISLVIEMIIIIMLIIIIITKIIMIILIINHHNNDDHDENHLRIATASWCVAPSSDWPFTSIILCPTW